MDHEHSEHGAGGGTWNTRVKIALVGFILIAGYFLVTEHRAHVALALPYLPFLLLLACPFLHFFMHGGHGDHSGHEQSAGKDRT